MKHCMCIVRIGIVLFMILLALPLNAEDAKKSEKSLKDTIHFSALFYIHSRYNGNDEQIDFFVSRGYLTAKFKPLKWFESRITVDGHQDESGDYKMRWKYLYGKFKIPMETFITDPFVEFGIVHTPWLDYEQKINRYRMQGKMFVERYKLFNSAGLGLTGGFLLGKKLDKDYQKLFGKAYAGTWGSVSLGVYNGGGYHALELNDNKVFEGRISVRPLGPLFPNLQISWFSAIGKGNTEEEPDRINHIAMLSVEHKYFTFAGTYTFGEGNQKGNKVEDNGDAKSFTGFSAFGEAKVPSIKSSLFVRYDHFDWHGHAVDRIIGGVAFYFYKKCALVLDMDYAMEKDVDDAWQTTLTLQIGM